MNMAVFGAHHRDDKDSKHLWNVGPVSARLHDVTFQTDILILVAVRTKNLMISKSFPQYNSTGISSKPNPSQSLDSWSQLTKSNRQVNAYITTHSFSCTHKLACVRMCTYAGLP
jgi:hypothetical protein